MPLLDYGTPLIPRGLAPRLEQELPDVERAVALFPKPRSLLTVEDRQIYVEDVFSTDEHFFQVFSFSLVRGNPNMALMQPGQVILAEPIAHQLFGDEDPVGRVVTLGSQDDHAEYQVMGIAATAPSNSHFQFNVLLSLSEWDYKRRYGQTVEWGRYDYYLYLLFHETTDPETAQANLTAFETSRGHEPNLRLEPLTKIHLYADPTLSSEIAPQSDVQYLYVLSMIALLTLLVACVNYINLAIASGVHRAREVGVRKVMGAARQQLIQQFLSESVVTILITLPLALVLAHLALPVAGQMLGEPLAIDYSRDGLMILALTGVIFVVGLAAGSYPAFFLSAFQPVKVLYGGMPLTGKTRRWFGVGLVAFQFAVTMALIISVLVIHLQLDFIQGQRLGSEASIVVIDGNVVGDHALTFKQELEKQSYVASVATGLPPGLDYGGFDSLTDPETQETVALKRTRGDADYIPTLGLRLVAGQNFTSGTAEQGVIINETAARVFNISPDQVGAWVEVGPGNDMLLRGIVADFHYRTLHDPVQPLYMTQTSAERSSRGFFMVRLRPASLAEGLEQVEAVWNRFVPDRPFDFTFLDDQIAAQYTAEQRLVGIFGSFSGLAILIACLGLFGLAAFTIERRKQEMGVRKVMGASARRIFLSLSGDLLKPAVLACIVAMPVAYVAMYHWLTEFAYRIALSWWIFLIAALTTLVIAWLTVSYHAVRAACVNPIELLRHE